MGCARVLQRGLITAGLGFATLLPAKTIPGLALDGPASTREIQVRLDAVTAPDPAVAVIATPPWSPHDPVRDGAIEFEVLFTAARLLRENALAGLVAVGNRHGVFTPAAEAGLHRAMHLGLPVVRLAAAGQVAAPADDLLISGGSLSPEEAQRVLQLCLARHGTLTPAANPERPTAAERAAWRRQLAKYQRDFDAHIAATEAARGWAVAAR